MAAYISTANADAELIMPGAWCLVPSHWQLAMDLQRASNPLLWLACVGLTDHFINDRLDRCVSHALCLFPRFFHFLLLSLLASLMALLNRHALHCLDKTGSEVAVLRMPIDKQRWYQR